MTSSPAPKRGFSSVGRNPSRVATPSSVNAPRKSTSAPQLLADPPRRVAHLLADRTAGSQNVAQPA